ncbi:MAG: O-methyltransferase [Bacteroidia bacterium]|nr:MAG: O-methyltransferase [Bacteroidia bacterium]
MKIDIVLHRLVHYIKYHLHAKDIHHIHSPFLFELVKHCFDKNNYYYSFDELNLLRKKLSCDNRTIIYDDIGAKSTVLKKNTSIKEILSIATTPPEYSELYFRIIQHLNCQNILELGTSIGMNTLYLAKATQGKVTSIEGQKILYQYATELLKQQHITNVKLIHGLFDDVLDNLLQNQTFDFVFIDGNHTYDATLNYYTKIYPQIAPKSVLIIDDIYWNKEMTKAWREICQRPEKKYTLDLFRCGIVLFNPNIQYSQHFILKY